MGDTPSPAVSPPSGGNNKGMPLPRSLKERETYQEIIQWATTVKNYFRRDEYMYPFVNTSLKWNSSKPHYNLMKEHDEGKAKRKVEEMAEDLVAFLETIAGFIPGGHLRHQIINDSTSFGDIIRLVKEFYGAEVDTVSGLDFMYLEREPQGRTECFLRGFHPTRGNIW